MSLSRAGDARSSQAEPRRSEQPAAKQPAADPVRGPPGQALGESDAEGAERRNVVMRHPFVAAALAVLVLAALGLGVLWWLHGRGFESTSDAFIAARTVPISAQLSGQIVSVPVTDNQFVTAGVVLVRIDDRNYRIALAQAQAQVDAAKAGVADAKAQLGAQNAKIAQARGSMQQAQAALTFSRQQNQRAQNLVSRGAGTQQNAQQAASDLLQKQASLSGAQFAVTAAQKQLAVLAAQAQSAESQLEQALAEEDLARVNLSRTVLRAPTSGRVTKLSAAKGAYAHRGEPVTTFVPRKVWSQANFKETALASMRPGQPVSIAVDAYPGRTFHGHVDSIQAGSGAAFSLLPAENATGNFVKVVQRVPVKIIFDRPPDVHLGPGMSVVPTVKVR